MVIGIIGENCSGKSTLAEAIKKEINAEVITGKDYLRMARSESEAVALFKAKLLKAVSGENIVYVISEQTTNQSWVQSVLQDKNAWESACAGGSDAGEETRHI